MKRSKMFLAGTTALLAIAGVAAAKAHRAFSNTAKCYFYTPVAGCANIGQQLGYTINNQASGAVTLTTTPTGKSQTLCVSLPNAGFHHACTSKKIYTNGNNL